MRTEGNKRKTVEEVEESMLRKTVTYLKMLEGTEAKKESEDTLEVAEENEEEVGWRTEGETLFEEQGGDLDPEQVRQGREGDERQGQYTWDVRVWLVARSDVESRQGSDLDEMDRPSGEGRRRS